MSAAHHYYLNDPQKLAQRARLLVADLRPLAEEFTSIVVTGLSGIVLGSIVAHALSKNLVIIRKQGEDSHGEPVEGSHLPGDSYIIIDDFVSSGDTMRRIASFAKTRRWGRPLRVVLHALCDPTQEPEWQTGRYPLAWEVGTLFTVTNKSDWLPDPIPQAALAG